MFCPWCSQNRMFIIGPSCSCIFSEMISLCEPHQGKHKTNTCCGNLKKSLCVRFWLINDCCRRLYRIATVFQNVCLWMFEVCVSLSHHIPHTMDLIGLFSSQTRSMHANVFNLGNGSQSWFHMNNNDEKM